MKGSELDKKLNNEIKESFAVKGARKASCPIFTPNDRAQLIADEFALKAGVGAINNPGVWGIRAQGDAVFLTYSGRNYCGMNVSKNEMTCCSDSAVDFVRKNCAQVLEYQRFYRKDSAHYPFITKY